MAMIENANTVNRLYSNVQQLGIGPDPIGVAVGEQVRVPVSDRESMIHSLGSEVSLVLGLSGDWKVASLPKCQDKLVGWQQNASGPFSLVEMYTTRTDDGVGRHARLYAHPEDTHIPMIIVAEQDVADVMQKREPERSFQPLEEMVGYGAEHVQSVTNQAIKSLGGLAQDTLLWQAKRARLQLVGVREDLAIGDIPIRVLVYEDKVGASGHVLLIWSQDTDKPLAMDTTTKPLWGLILTNSQDHRPERKWHQITPHN